MHIFPIAERELRVASRRPKTYRRRVIAALFALVFAGYCAWILSTGTMGRAVGRQLFTGLAQVAFVYCLFAGAGSTADVLSKEKREGTMGLLFLTQLHSYDIVIGKLVSASLFSVYGFLATVPIFGICLLIGGVQSSEFWRMVLALFTALFFSLSVGLFVSAGCRDERRATQNSSGIMLLFGIVLPGLGEYLRSRTSAIDLGFFLKMLSPSYLIELSTTPTTSLQTYVTSFSIIQFLSWSSLLLACWILHWTWRDQTAQPKQVGSALFGKLSAAPISSSRSFLDINAFYWLVLRSTKIVRELWLSIGVFISLAAVGGWWFHDKVPVFIVCMILAIVLHTCLKMQFCAMGCERLAHEKNEGTLELLLATPLSVPEIIRGQWHGLKRQFLTPAVVVLILDVAMLAIVLFAQEPDFVGSPEAALNCGILLIVATIMLVLDLVALGWVGMWQAIHSKNVLQARSRTQIRVLIVPWMALFLFFTSNATHQSVELSPLRFLSIWFVVGALNSLIFAIHSRRRLYQDFRTVLEPQPSVRGILAICIDAFRGGRVRK